MEHSTQFVSQSGAAIEALYRNGNLHVTLQGAFTSSLATELAEALAERYQGQGNIFIHTEQLTTIEPESKGTFAEQISTRRLPRAQLYLTGAKGLDISPEGVRVIVYEKKKKGSCAGCRNCNCHNKAALTN